MNRLQLAQLRDIAIEHLPAAQQYREEVKARPTEERESQSYAWALWRIADETLARHESSSAELAAAQLLLGLTSWETYDPSLPRLRDTDPSPEDARTAMRQGIANAVKTLANVTGRDIPMDDPVVYFVDPAMPADAPVAKGEAKERQRQDALAVELDAILVGMKTKTPTKVMAELRKQIGLPNTCILNNIGDGIEWENDAGDIKKLNIPALKERIKNWKQKAKERLREG